MGQVKYDLPEEVTIYTVSELKPDLIDDIEGLSSGTELLFNCSNLEEIDAAGIQLLLAVVKTSLQEDFDLFLEDVSYDIKQTLSLVGVKEILLEEDNSNGE
ncbi:MAG: STAS domain-containing protein [Halanaerobacter sp.]